MCDQDPRLRGGGEKKGEEKRRIQCAKSVLERSKGENGDILNNELHQSLPIGPSLLRFLLSCPTIPSSGPSRTWRQIRVERRMTLKQVIVPKNNTIMRDICASRSQQSAQISASKLRIYLCIVSRVRLRRITCYRIVSVQSGRDGKEKNL